MRELSRLNEQMLETQHNMLLAIQILCDEDKNADGGKKQHGWDQIHMLILFQDRMTDIMPN